MNIWRNRWLTVTAISVMVITLVVLGSLLVIYQLAQVAAQNLKDRVDISVFFDTDTVEDKILEVKEDFETLEEVKQVTYISAAEAKATFQQLHKDDIQIQESLRELEAANRQPLQPSLVITADELNQYPVIYQKIVRSRFQPLISEINFEDSRQLIEKLDRITSGIRNVGIILTGIFGTVAVLVMFNTLRLTIFSRREEIEIMRLVGASNSFIRGPFLIEGLLYGVIGTIFGALALYPMLQLAAPWITGFFGINVAAVTYFGIGYWIIVASQLLAGVFLGVISSVIATKRHLRV